MSAVVLVILAAAMAYIFRAVLLSWSSQEKRAGIQVNLNRGMEEIARDLRKARQISAVNNDEIRFTPDKSSYYIYYLYNLNDPYPSSFNQGAYELRKAALSGGISGTFTYGSGQIIISGVVAPPASDLSFSASLVTIDLNVSRADETVRLRTQVKSRNS
jgi:hypothetical protein